MKKIFGTGPLLGLLMLVTALGATSAQAGNFDIVAVVDNSIITAYDVKSRADLLMFSSNIPNRPEVRAQIEKQALQGLINETLQISEAQQLGLEIPEAEVDEILKDIANRNKLTLDQLPAFFKKHGVDIETLRTQARANVAWIKVVRQKFGRDAVASDAAVDDELARIHSKVGEEHVLLGEILLAYGPDKTGAELEKQARQIEMEVRRGATFTALAQQLSDSSTAQFGGDTGWLPVSQLSPPLANAIQDMKPGQLSEPIATEDGYYLVFLRQRQILGQPTQDENVVDLFQMYLNKKISEREQIEIVKRARSEIKSCEAAELFAKETNSPVAGKLEKVDMRKLPEPLQKVVGSLQDGQVSPPVQLNNGIVLFTMCGKSAVPEGDGLPNREQVSAKLRQDFLQRRAKQYLSELRRSAIIEIRGEG